MIAGEVAAPSWELPLPRPQARSSSPLSTHSRSSSRSSNSSSGFSAASAVSSATSYISSAASGRSQTMSRRERARQARVYVDHSKKDVTPYDGGKTTVLSGGVMLGGGPRAARA